jgi:hypothetical protein
MTPQLPPGATNTARSVPGDGPDPYRATQGENRNWSAEAGPGGSWSTFVASLAPIAAHPSTEETSP